jgi:zinc transport system permease protein
MNVNSYLFGSIYTLGGTDLYVIGGVTAVVLIAIRTQAKELFLITFDEDAAAVSGLPVKFYNVMISVLTALVISVSIKIVGALLVSALLTIPAACSLIIARSFRQSVITVVIIGELAVVCGLLIAGVWNLAPGGTIVLLLITVLLLLLLVRRGVRMGS